VAIALDPSRDCDGTGTLDSCDTAVIPFYGDRYWQLPGADATMSVDLVVHPGTSSSVRVRVEAIGDYGEPFKGEWLDAEIEGLGTIRLQGSQCGWMGDERTWPLAAASGAVSDGLLRVTLTVGPGVDPASCGEHRVRIQAWYDRPTVVDDLNGNGRPDSCEAGSEPPAGLPGLVQRGAGHWYWVSDDARTYDGAVARARELGGHLVTVTSPAEWQFVRTQLALPDGPLFWMGYERPCEVASLAGYAWTTGEPGSFQAPWVSGYVGDCNWRWALMRTDGWHTGYAWWCCHRYVVEFDFRDCDGDGRLDMYEPPSAEDDPDGDQLAIACDPDDDDDGVLDGADAFPLDAGESVDTDGDGTGNNADPDDDNDGVLDGADAFPLDAGESADTDGDGTGNNADADDDNDGVLDGADAFPLDAGESIDTDGDGTGNNADADDDNDGAEDAVDGCPADASKTAPGQCGCGVADTDTDGDGAADCVDNCSLPNPAQSDCDGDGIGDACDIASLFQPIDLTEFSLNSQHPQQYGLPWGDQLLGGVPFRFPANGQSAWAAAIGQPVGTVTFEIVVPSDRGTGVDGVYTLLNTWWGVAGPQSRARVAFFGTNNAYYEKALVGNVDIRDHNTQGAFTRLINGTTSVEVFRNQSGSVVDRQFIELPEQFLTERLERIVFIDTGADWLQRLVVQGVTLKIAGDCNGNGIPDGCEVSPSTDINSDGVLDSCQAGLGDLNADGSVNGVDLGIMLGAWGVDPDGGADINGDGVVDGIDLGLLLGNWS
jgi:hypothetical protein